MPTDNASAPNGVPPLGRAVWIAICGLGLTQIIGWGSTYYLLTILGPNIAADLGLSPQLTSSGLSILLALGGVLGPYSGRMMDMYGARPVMATGSVIACLGLIALSLAQGSVGYILGWLVIGCSASMVLYPAAFTALTQASPASARRAITLLTLAGGLASTVFWPLSEYLLAIYDWRSVCRIYAGINLLACLPLHLLVIPGRSETAKLEEAHGASAPPGLPDAARARAFLLLASVLALNGLLVTGVLNQFLVLMTSLGQSASNAVFFGMVFGLAQVSARLADMLFGTRYDALKAGVAVTAGFTLAVMALMAGGASPAAGLAFAAFFGISNGVFTIVRGTLVLALFGVKGYGEQLGTITVAQGLAGATAPVLLSLVLSHWGGGGALVFCGSVALLALVAMSALFRHASRAMAATRTD